MNNGQTCRKLLFSDMEEILEVYELQYSDLILLSADVIPASPIEIQRLELISKELIHNLGPNGPGLLSIKGVPKARLLRRTLLPSARKLALLDNDDRKRILKEHNLGSDVPLKNLDRTVSSFAMQMKFDQEFDDKLNGDAMAVEADDTEFKDLGLVFRGLGSSMMELGLRLARACDKELGGCDLEHTLLQCGTAKCRLIHYHSPIDNVIIKEKARRKGGDKNGKHSLRTDPGIGETGELELWQKWHYDYGIFTILTAPMFVLSNGSDDQECQSPTGHTYLQILHPKKNRVLLVKASEDSFIVQVGESADVLSKGKLRATLHCVRRPTKMDNLSRETFVVFLQPAWNKTFSLSDYPIKLATEGDQNLDSYPEGAYGTGYDSNELIKKIHEIVPPLSSRLKDGMSFADFSRETTKQYYGGTGLQSNR